MIDAHNHLDFEDFDADRASVVAQAREQGVVGWILAGTHPDTWTRTRTVATSTGGVALLGVHPGWARDITDWDAVIAELEAAAPPGIGEIGLDRRVDADLDWQTTGLRAQLALARALDRPVAFHSVGAYPEHLATVRRDGLPAAGGMIHRWSGPPDRVPEAMALGLSLSFGLAITNPHAPRQMASARAVTLDRLLIETDCPDQAPRGLDRTRGAPADLARVAAAVAGARKEDVATVVHATHANTARLFGLGSPP
ncbi:MAG: TatD family hydrolase [Myxococcota bacterium]